MKKSYRSEFKEQMKVDDYELNRYAAGSYGSLLWSVERRYLEGLLRRLPVPTDRVDYLDFACGTGRIVAFMESRVRRARGIDVSAEMLEFARQKVSRAELIQNDITAMNELIEGRYDLITAFRFFVNAEPALRSAAMQSLSARLKDNRSRLVFSVQASLPSHKLVLWSENQLRKALGKPQQPWNYLIQRWIERLLAEADLEVEEVFGYDFFSSKGLRLLSYDRLLTLEQALAGKPVIHRLGGHRMYVARRRSS